MKKLLFLIALLMSNFTRQDVDELHLPSGILFLLLQY